MMKKTLNIMLAVICTAVVMTGIQAQAQDLIIYPAKGQSQEQMEKDKYECYKWAKQQTGVDPMQQAQNTEVPLLEQ